MNKRRSLCLRPRNFTPAGVVRAARLEDEPPFIRPRKRTGAKAAGIAYERKAQRYLQREFPHHYIAGPWFSFANEGSAERKWCQPDGLLIDYEVGLITIVEIKLRHTAVAWWQTRHLYEPVTRHIFGEELWQYNVLEICRWYDPEVRFPERYKLVETIGALKPGKFGVHIWKKP